jgi:translation initiation factor IF-1
MSATVNRGGKIRRKTKSGRVKGNKHECVVDLENGDRFGTVLKLLGGNQVSVKNHTGLEETVLIPGRMRKKQWIKIGNIVSIGKDNEITSIVRDGDKNHKNATSLVGTNGIPLDDDSGDDDEDEEAEEEGVSGIADKLKLKLSRREGEKQRDLTRKTGDRQFTDPNELMEKARKEGEEIEEPIDFDSI